MFRSGQRSVSEAVEANAESSVSIVSHRVSVSQCCRIQQQSIQYHLLSSDVFFQFAEHQHNVFGTSKHFLQRIADVQSPLSFAIIADNDFALSAGFRNADEYATCIRTVASLSVASATTAAASSRRCLQLWFGDSHGMTTHMRISIAQQRQQCIHGWRFKICPGGQRLNAYFRPSALLCDLFSTSELQTCPSSTRSAAEQDHAACHSGESITAASCSPCN